MLPKIAISVALASCLLTASTAAPDDAVGRAWLLLAEGKDLSGVNAMYDSAFRPDGRVRSDLGAQMWSQVSPRLDGLVHLPPVEADDANKVASPEDIMAVRNAEFRDALETIKSYARNRRIVVLNEEHNSPADRAFGLEVAKALRPLGYNVLAAETFSNDIDSTKTDMSALVQRGYPIRITGTYIGDPVFADFIRQALGIGYIPVAYEQTNEQAEGAGDPIDVREEAEASNLSKIIASMPQAKFLIYVGYSHAAKVPVLSGDGEKTHLWMAGRLKIKTGIDPLTIDQTTFGEGNSTPFSRTLRALIQRNEIRHSIALFSRGNPLCIGQYHGAIDLQIVHPATHVIHGRPDWLEGMGRHFVRVPTKLIPRSGYALIQAYLRSENKDSVPIDQVVVDRRDMSSWLMLPDKPVRLVVREVVAERPRGRMVKLSGGSLRASSAQPS